MVDKQRLKRFALIGGAIALAVLAACALVAWEYKDAWMPYLAQLRASANGWLTSLRAHPLAFFAIMATLPIIPVPMSPFYLATGAFPTPVAVAGILIAIPINFAITYWLAVTFMRPLAEKLLARANMKIPEPSSRRNGILFSIFVRACGSPYTLQNYIIPLAKVNFRDYMLFGLPFQFIPAFVMMFLGDSLLKGQVGKAFLAIAVLVCLGILTKLLKDYMDRRKAAQDAAAEPPKA